MLHKCPDSECSAHKYGLNTRSFIRKGVFFRRSDGQRIPRFLCCGCGKSFSSATSNSCYRQKKRTLNTPLVKLLCSAVSQRRAAKLLRVNRKTVVKKFRYSAEQARLKHQNWMQSLAPNSVSKIQFDDLETSEHTKCKPLSVVMAVEPKSRKILGFQVSKMPAKGHLAAIALKKYGPRRDGRPKAWNAFFASLKRVTRSDAQWFSDQNPYYLTHLKRHHPQAFHRGYPGQRGSIGGYGELKKTGFDPLFKVNHTFAMLRANINRLLRRTWCTTKKIKGLIDHISLFVQYYNQSLTPAAIPS